jgi:fatty-acyl-CoA synthase
LVAGTTADGETLRDHCRAGIARHKVPRYVRIVDEFPLTVTGKVQKFRMREMAVAELGLEAAATTKTA